LLTRDVDLHVTLIGEATSLASLGPLQPIDTCTESNPFSNICKNTFIM
jgi:hypothetical protein